MTISDAAKKCAESISDANWPDCRVEITAQVVQATINAETEPLWQMLERMSQIAGHHKRCAIYRRSDCDCHQADYQRLKQSKGRI